VNFKEINHMATTNPQEIKVTSVADELRPVRQSQRQPKPIARTQPEADENKL
jgi:hypothetical protein